MGKGQTTLFFYPVPVVIIYPLLRTLVTCLDQIVGAATIFEEDKPVSLFISSPPPPSFVIPPLPAPCLGRTAYPLLSIFRAQVSRSKPKQAQTRHTQKNLGHQ